ncbi:hypothetical protein V8C42DRAFT_296958 [Trichoderma barbatum]
MADGDPVRGVSRPCRIYWGAGVLSTSCLVAGLCPALVASLALSPRPPICWRWVIVELQSGPMHWQRTRTVLYTSVAAHVPAHACMPAASNRMDRGSMKILFKLQLDHRGSYAILLASQIGPSLTCALCLVAKQTGSLARYPLPPCRQRGSGTRCYTRRS